MQRKVTVRGVVLHEGKLLCARLKQYSGALPGAGSYWCIPGGKLELGESLQAGVRREMVEETGIEPVLGNLLYIQQFTYNEVDYLEFFFHVTNARDYLAIDLSRTSHGEEEIAEIGFIDPKAHDIKPAFFSEQSLETDAAAGYTKLFSYQ